MDQTLRAVVYLNGLEAMTIVVIFVAADWNVDHITVSLRNRFYVEWHDR